MIVPSNIESPFTPLLSSLSGKSSCNPRQIPRNGLPVFVKSIMVSLIPKLFIVSIVSPNEPTPGSIAPSALKISSLLLVTTQSAPMCFKAL